MSWTVTLPCSDVSEKLRLCQFLQPPNFIQKRWGVGLHAHSKQKERGQTYLNHSKFKRREPRNDLMFPTMIPDNKELRSCLCHSGTRNSSPIRRGFLPRFFLAMILFMENRHLNNQNKTFHCFVAGSIGIEQGKKVPKFRENSASMYFIYSVAENAEAMDPVSQIELSET